MNNIIKHTDGNYYIKLENGNYSKIIASTDSSLGLPLLSEQSIKLLIDYYNKNKKMPESIDIIGLKKIYNENNS